MNKDNFVKCLQTNPVKLHLKVGKVIEGTLVAIHTADNPDPETAVVYNKDDNRFYAVQYSNIAYVEIVADLNIEKDIKRIDDEIATYQWGK
jgi:hypothetical protein